MNQFIKRDFARTESDDYKLNVQSTEGEYGESLPIYENGKMIGWMIQERYE